MEGLCEVILPDVTEIETGHRVRCHIYTNEGKDWMQEHGEKREIRKIPKAIAS